MKQNTLLIQSRITPEAFREFAVFDTLYRQKRYLRPLVFAAILAGFAAVCFSQRGQREQAALLGGVLLAVGLGLPLVYFLTFFYSVYKQAKQLKGKKAPLAYTVELSQEQVAVLVGEQRMEYRWEDILAVYRIRHSTCLYVAANRAYLLPAAADGREEQKRWAFLCEHISNKNRKDLRKTGTDFNGFAQKSQ